ncbi:spore maturation protein [candidate division KSB1 bacterium]|nr:spore maturation protein [candidate division KSB1 bacterium]RQW03161.1 MAG: spore maturation protein [candidate division KSB1 bacterium]
MNYVWLFLIAAAVIVGALTGTIKEVTQSALDMSGTAVQIALGLIGIMTLWLGMMKIAEAAGLIRLLARAITPISRRLFPDIPADHPAIGSMMLNIAANWLGLGNAATPFGIKAMQQLQELNPDKETATNAMIMFLALNTASITLVPMTIIGVRTSLGSSAPGAIIGPTIFASTMATVAAIVAVKFFSFFAQRDKNVPNSSLFSWRGVLIVAAILTLLVFGIFSGMLQKLAAVVPFSFKSVISFISTWTIPFLLLMIPVLAVFKRVQVYEVFVEGAKEGFQVAVRIIPFLVAILAAIAMFRASGAMDFFTSLLSPVTNLIGLPAEILPAALMRPLSGSGTLGIITELLETHSPDSFIGYLASTIYGCTETTFYVIAVYFGAVGIKKTRFAVPAGLFADVAGVLAALFICRLLFG